MTEPKYEFRLVANLNENSVWFKNLILNLDLETFELANLWTSFKLRWSRFFRSIDLDLCSCIDHPTFNSCKCLNQVLHLLSVPQIHSCISSVVDRPIYVHSLIAVTHFFQSLCQKHGHPGLDFCSTWGLGTPAACVWDNTVSVSSITYIHITMSVLVRLTL